jgi:ubiquitin-protein ligase
MTESQIIHTDTVKRLLKDVRQIIKHPLTDNGIYYSHDENDMTQGYAMIVGPSDTPYFGGYFFFKFKFPNDYPFTPPEVTYMTNDGCTRFNPNLYRCGKVCVSILNTWYGDQWSACQTINSVLFTICSLFTKIPFENEPGHCAQSKECIPYQKSIEFKNIDFAICDMIMKNKIPEPFHIFYTHMKEHFINNYEKLLKFVQTNKQSNPKSKEIIEIYKMVTNINYSELEQKLIETKLFVESNTT